MSSTVVPEATIFLMASNISRTISGASPREGSSINNSFGAAINPRPEAAPFRDHGHPRLHHPVRLLALNFLAQEPDPAGFQRQKSRDGPQERGLARPIRSDEADDFPRQHFKGNRGHGPQASKVPGEIFYFQ
jgi:hypothetical protein